MVFNLSADLGQNKTQGINLKPQVTNGTGDVSVSFQLERFGLYSGRLALTYEEYITIYTSYSVQYAVNFYKKRAS